jgi:AraC-like DNA-binding protein
MLRVIPDGGTDVVWDGRALWVARAVAGPVRHPVDDEAGRVGLRLRPGSAAAVLGVPVAALPTRARLGDVWEAPTARRIEERLAATAGAAAAADAALGPLLLELVAGGLAAGDAPDRRVLAAVDGLTHPEVSVRDTADGVGLSGRQLRRLVEHHVGLSPTELRLVPRFQRFMRRATTAGRWPTAAAAAADCGYTDQSHLTRDCRRFAGTTPGALMTPPRTGGRRRGPHVARGRAARSPRQVVAAPSGVGMGPGVT